MDRAEQLTRELYIVHKSGEHSVAYAVARIMALEELLFSVMDYNQEYEFMPDDLVTEIEEILPDPNAEEEEETDGDQS